MKEAENSLQAKLHSRFLSLRHPPEVPSFCLCATQPWHSPAPHPAARCCAGKSRDPAGPTCTSPHAFTQRPAQQPHRKPWQLLSKHSKQSFLQLQTKQCVSNMLSYIHTKNRLISMHSLTTTFCLYSHLISQPAVFTVQLLNNQLHLLRAQIHTELFQRSPPPSLLRNLMHKCQITLCFWAWVSEYNFHFPIHNKMHSNPVIYFRSIHKFHLCPKLLSERLVHGL